MEMFAQSSWQCWCSTQILSECFPSVFFAHLLVKYKASKDSARKEAMKSFYFRQFIFTCHPLGVSSLVGPGLMNVQGDCHQTQGARWLQHGWWDALLLRNCAINIFNLWYIMMFWHLKKKKKKPFWQGKTVLFLAANSYRLVKGSFWSAD